MPPLQIVEVADTGLAASPTYAYPVAAGTSIYWFPTAAGPVLKYNSTTGAVTTIATGIAHGWAGAVQGDDGYIYATPTSTHRNVLRINPANDAVTTTVHAAVTARNLGVPSSVVVGGQYRIYAFPVGVQGVDVSHRVYLRIDCDTFTASAWEPGSGTASAPRLCGDSIAHPNGLIYVSPKNQTTFGYDILALDPTTDTFTAVETGGRLSAMVLRSFTTTSPIYLFGDAGAGKLTVTGTPAHTILGSLGSDRFESGFGEYGRRPALLLSDGNILAVGNSSSDDAWLVNTSTDSVTSLLLTDRGFLSGGAIGSNGKAYFFSSGDREALEYDANTNAFTYIEPDTPDLRQWGEPVAIGSKVFTLSSGSTGITKRIGMIDLGARRRRGLGLVRG